MPIWLCCTLHLHLPVQVRSSSISVCFQRLCVSRFSECRRRDVCTLASLLWCHLCLWRGSFWVFPYLKYRVVGQDSGGQCHWSCARLQKSHCVQLILSSWQPAEQPSLFVMPCGRFHDVHQSVVQRKQWWFLYDVKEAVNLFLDMQTNVSPEDVAKRLEDAGYNLEKKHVYLIYNELKSAFNNHMKYFAKISIYCCM